MCVSQLIILGVKFNWRTDLYLSITHHNIILRRINFFFFNMSHFCGSVLCRRVRAHTHTQKVKFVGNGRDAFFPP